MSLGSVAKWAVAFFALLVSAVFVSTGRAVTESTTYQADAAHSGYLYGAGVVPPLRRVWVRRLGSGNDAVPIDDGHVFAFARVNGTAFLEARDLASGHVGWRTSLGVPGASWGVLAVDGGEVYTAYARFSPPDPGTVNGIVLSAYDEATGALLWTENIGQEYPTSIVTANGTLYLLGYGDGGTVFAVDERTGTALWGATTDDQTPVTLAGSVVVDIGVCGPAYGFDAATGASVWSESSDCGGGGGGPSSFDGANVWGGEWTLHRRIYNALTGRVVGHYSGYAPAFGYGEAVQAHVARGELQIRALAPGTLATRWVFNERVSASVLGSDPLLADGYVFAASIRGIVWALRPCTGRIAWHGKTGVALPFADFDPLPGLTAGDGYLVVPTATGLAVFKGSRAPTASPPSCR